MFFNTRLLFGNLSTVAALGLFAGSGVYAGQYGYDEEVTVTAARTPLDPMSTMAATTVINSNDIETGQARDLPDALRRLSGIEFDDNGGRGALSSIKVRGTEADHVLFLVDGIRVSDASSGATSIQSIPLAHIERIEIVRGPRSSLYGADALGGVIQVFTKSGQQASSAAEPSARLEYGSHNRRDSEAGVLGRAGNFFYRVGGGYEETNGINRTVGSAGADLDRDSYRETSYAASAGYNFAEYAGRSTQLRLGYTGAQGKSEFDSGADDDHIDFNNGVGYLRLQGAAHQTLGYALTLGYSEDDQRTRGAFPANFKTTRDSANLQFDYRVASASQLLFGLDYYLDKVASSANFIDDERGNDAFYVQYLGDYGLVDLQLGFRHDNNQAFGEKTTGNIALGVNPSEHLMVSVSHGSAFKAPTFNDMFFPFTDFGFGFTFEGNPDLQPESSTTTELLVKAAFDAISGYVSLYSTEVEDLIASTGATVENIAEADISGADLGVEFVVGGVLTQLGLAYVDAENAKSGERLPRRARTTA
ncbi:MAG: TonB-dependent receptor, partial [Gammaproteobacteria bacterium]|nr:TonB-dependent receptor [Gammaproteobacteria bacterium]